MAAKSKKKAKKSAPVKKAKAIPKKFAIAKKPAKTAKTAQKKAAKPSATPARKAGPTKKPVAKVAKAIAKPPQKTTDRKIVAAIGAKPIIRTGPSIAPRNFGKSPIAALRGAPTPMKAGKVKPLTAKDLEYYRDLLLKLRDRVIDEISFLANDNLNKSAKDNSGDLSSYSFHMADQGTDNFDREFAASLLNNEHDVLYEIEEALRRIEQGAYGVCEMSGKPIERERLKALPFARYSVAVQTEMERGKPKFRPFRRTTSIQSAETT